MTDRWNSLEKLQSGNVAKATQVLNLMNSLDNCIKASYYINPEGIDAFIFTSPDIMETIGFSYTDGYKGFRFIPVERNIILVGYARNCSEMKRNLEMVKSLSLDKNYNDLLAPDAYNITHVAA
jgi:hypothetical protein